ncbi:hypothetical protein FKM82_014628 [Ascaphus truei]
MEKRILALPPLPDTTACDHSGADLTACRAAVPCTQETIRTAAITQHIHPPTALFYFNLLKCIFCTRLKSNHPPPPELSAASPADKRAQFTADSIWSSQTCVRTLPRSLTCLLSH